MKRHSLSQRFVSVDFITRFLLAIGLLLLVWISTTPFMPPPVVPASATGKSFSAERAMDDLRVVAREPHAAGSAAQLRVRDHLLAEAAEVGLKGEVQKSGIIENVIVRLPGTASTHDVLITAHYDSHPPAPGAGDNGMPVAAMLETMRALRASPPLRNDIVFLFTDGEEKGWLGAFLGALIILTLLMTAAWNGLLATHPITYDQSIHYPDFEGISSWMAGIMALAFILGCATLYVLSRRIDGVSLTVSGLSVFLIVWWFAYFFLDSVNPLTNPPLAWSFLAGVTGLAIVMFVRHRAFMAALLFLAAVPIFVLSIPVLLPATLQPQEGAWVPVLEMGLMLGVLVPQLVFITGRLSFSDGGHPHARLRPA